LVASEIFSAGGTEFQRPGLGAFIAVAGRNGDIPSIAIGIAVLAAVVLTLDIFVWRPLGAWSERFRMETAPGREIPRVPSPYERFRWLPRLPKVRKRIIASVQPALERYHRLSLRFERAYTQHPKAVREIRRVDLALFVVVFVVVVATGLVGLVQMFLRPLPPNASLLPSAAELSFSRLLVAYAIALVWTIPVAAMLGESQRAARYLTPALELFASLPATALLPVIVGFALLLAPSVGAAAQLAAILIALFSMQWYLLFNLIAGVRSIPDDLKEAARSFGLRGRAYWKRLLLPAIAPSLLTGSITAWGAGWNALIVSEYIQYAHQFFENAKEFKVLDLVRFDLTERDFVCVVGPSGSGKSTLLRIIVGLEKPTSGEVFFEGEPIRADNPQVAMVFQSFALFPWLTVEENVELGLEAKGTPPEERRKIARKFIDAVGLTGFEDA